MARATLDELAVCVVPAARCYSPLANDPLALCGAIAAWQRDLGGGNEPSFHCDAHRLAGDVPIRQGRTFRRVRLKVEIFLSGASSHDAVCRADAVQALERAVYALGGYVDWEHVRCSRVRAALPPGAGEGRAVGGDVW